MAGWGKECEDWTTFKNQIELRLLTFVLKQANIFLDYAVVQDYIVHFADIEMAVVGYKCEAST